MTFTCLPPHPVIGRQHQSYDASRMDVSRMEEDFTFLDSSKLRPSSAAESKLLEDPVEKSEYVVVTPYQTVVQVYVCM